MLCKTLTGFEGTFTAMFWCSVIAEHFIILYINISFLHRTARREREGGGCVTCYVQVINRSR